MEPDKDDVFGQELKSPEGVKLLFNCLQNLEAEIKNVKEISLATKKCQINSWATSWDEVSDSIYQWKICWIWEKIKK